MHCRALPLRSLPHQPRILLDFLDDFDRVSRFYPYRPNLQSALESAKCLQYPADRRATVGAVLREQNAGFGCGPETEANLVRLEQGASVVVTGQQVGLFTGPAYSVYKALTAVRVAKDLTAAGVDAVPVFWMATEDHDVDEVRHTTFFHDGSLTRFELPPAAGAGAPVGMLKLGDSIQEIVRAASLMLGGEEGGALASMLREACRPDETYGSSFAKIFSRLLSEFGIILMDPLDRRLHQAAATVYFAAIEHRDELNENLLRRGKELESAGYAPQVKVMGRTALLFYLGGGVRQAITAGEKNFRAGEMSWRKEELLSRIKAEPEKFSPNALLRPVVQDFLLPSVVYVGGPAEVSYCAQSEVLYQRILHRTPALFPRAGFTLVDPKAQRLLEHYGLQIENVWSGPQALRRELQTRNLPKPLARQFAKDAEQIEKQLDKWSASIKKVDPTLVPAVDTARNKIKFQTEKLLQMTGRALDQKNGVLAAHQEFLSNLLYPRKTLPSRELNFLPFLARWGTQGLRDLEAHASVKHLGQHFVVPIP